MVFEDAPGSRKGVARALIVGWIYALPYIPDVKPGIGSAIFGRIQKLKEWPNHDKRAEWCAMDRAARGAWEADRLHEKERERRIDLECLAPLRRAYERLSSRERPALLVRVTQYLMTGR